MLPAHKQFGVDRLVNMLALYFATLWTVSSALFFPYHQDRDIHGGKHIGNKIIITPYLEAGLIEEVRNLTLVPPLKGKVRSHAGFVTVNEKCDSNIFFWFFPAEHDYRKAPVAVWLQGGPGASSLFGLFLEHGPYLLKPNNKLALRKYSWTTVSNYIYIDNPVGTGFSYTGFDDCYSKNQTEIGTNLLSAVKQILRIFPEIQSNAFYVTGESYGGKYVPALAYAIHKDTDPKQKINLQGLAIGNGWVDPANQIFYSDYLYQLGLIDSNDKDLMKKEEDNCRLLISEEKWKDAFDCMDNMLEGDLVKTTFFQNVTGFRYYFNYLYATEQPQGNLASFVTSDSVRCHIHVGNSTFHDGKLVEKNLIEDEMQSVKNWLEELLEHYRVLIYNGQLDIIVAYPLTEAYLKKLDWSAAEKYRNAVRSIWKVNKDVAGYVKTAGNLTEILVRNAGHLVPMDQPKWSLDLITRFFNGKPYSPKNQI